MKTHVDSVFVAKGIAITLVVIGHYTPASLPHYWEQMRNVIYVFHMPFFFLLAGYLYGFSPPALPDYLIASGIILPFMIEEYFLRKYHLTKRYFFGLG